MLSDHSESMERLGQGKVDDAQMRAADKIEEAAEDAKEVLAEDARLAAAALTSEVLVLRKEITTLQKVDDFKAKVYIVAIVAAVFEVAAFVGLWFVSTHMEHGVDAIRTDLEVHRIRNEASHDCIAEKMAKLPSPEERAAGNAPGTGGEPLTREFLHEFLGCVADVAPTIVPPGAPDIRISTEDERRRVRP